MIREGDHRFFICCVDYEGRTPWRDLEKAQDAMVQIACPNVHWIEERERWLDRWIFIRTHGHPHGDDCDDHADIEDIVGIIRAHRGELTYDLGGEG